MAFQTPSWRIGLLRIWFKSITIRRG